MSFTLQDLLKEKARDESGRGVTFIAANGQDVSYTYKELFHVALRTLTFLQSEGLRPGDELVFQISDNRNLVVVFWACILGGVIPVPLAIGQNEEQVLKMFNVWSILNRPRLITNEINLGMI